MSDHKFEFDPGNFTFRKAGAQTWRLIKRVLLMILASLTATVLIYAAVALFYSTKEEKILYRENKMYEKIFPTLSPKEKLLEDVIAGLQYKDNEIYEQVFHSNAPNVDPISTLDFLYASDTIPDYRLESYTKAKSQMLMERSRDVDAAFEKIFNSISDSNFVTPPMTMPVKDVSYPQIGASTGRKMSPFLKAYVYHNGMDFIVLRGTEVYATGAGVVSDCGNNRSAGRYVVISHQGGFTTKFNHLEQVDVQVGQKVEAGQKIGTVGMSGKSSSPHLHYEVRRNEQVEDPVNYLFATVAPAEYANFLYMATNTLQSMD
ncbi:MAG: M23 family metallopeptidase [Bacteroidia bacterium]|nr:M23 family metallopeptidase [Bacteroidia bacterium]